MQLQVAKEKLTKAEELIIFSSQSLINKAYFTT